VGEEARCQRIDPDAVRRPLHRQRFREVADTRLGGGVVRHAGPTRERLRGQNVDDGPRDAPRRQPALQLLTAEERPVQHNVGHGPERVGPHGRGQHGEVGRRVVDQDGRRPERFLHRVERLGDLLGLADVSRRMGRPATDGLDGGDTGQAVLLRARNDPDGRAGARQLDGDGPTQTGAGPGDDGRRAGEGVGGKEE
jgi:hypothetical protein